MRICLVRLQLVVYIRQSDFRKPFFSYRTPLSKHRGLRIYSNPNSNSYKHNIVRGTENGHSSTTYILFSYAVNLFDYPCNVKNIGKFWQIIWNRYKLLEIFRFSVKSKCSSGIENRFDFSKFTSFIYCQKPIYISQIAGRSQWRPVHREFQVRLSFSFPKMWEN
jgi:hypothetical protein